MSEYQYYEWQTVDRLLTEREQDAVSGLSSHVTKAVLACCIVFGKDIFRTMVRIAPIIKTPFERFAPACASIPTNMRFQHGTSGKGN